MPSVVIEAGIIGTYTPYAIQGFEALQVGPLNDSVAIPSTVVSGDCDLDDYAELGGRMP